MLVRLALAWTDPFGIAHGVGELVDIDAVTLAELEEQGVVENMTEAPKPTVESSAWVGPGAPPKDDEPIEQNGWVGPGSPGSGDPEPEPDPEP
ncbi:hypothetical protein [Catellatospora bangladeshensis]|uniref:Uncharacterized protein n=1 Tax=Catellatospora bangladeshensis TaxID=310355 RepID=A0A8J3J6F5_9ACTN|nr:hypothetical protein [Catellatospora bangladeshensis]GIF78977.1 hypothetical protein Cba03nite_03260 [Catellatospora bangladeshensis]